MTDLPSIYDQPETKARLAQARLQLIRTGITQPRVRIGCAYQAPLPRIASDQMWVQTWALSNRPNRK